MKIVTIVGARPQFIKNAVVSRAIREHNKAGYPFINEVILHTGQHYDGNMSQVFFEELSIPAPAYNLGINSLSHGAMTGRMLANPPLLRARPKRPAAWRFQTLDTLRHRFIQRAGRLIRPQGQLTLTMSANPAVRKDLLHFLEAVQKAA